MRKITTLLFLSCAIATFALDSASIASKQGEPEAAKSMVYMTREISPEALVRIFQALGRSADGHRVAVKISTGESGNPNYLKPALIRNLVDSVHGTIVECNTAYGGKRNTFDAHWQTVHEHGFDSSSILIVDIADIKSS